MLPADAGRTRAHPESLKDAVARLAPWAVFLTATALLLRPILITSIAADDLLNPFSQIYHAGTGIDPILRHTIHDVSATGHFNYIGQAIGNLVVLVYTYLIGNFSIRYSLVYGLSRYLSYVITFLVAARALRDLGGLIGLRIGVWRSRFVVLLLFAAILQIHVPWSNDPVASYPLAGYVTAAIGIGFISLYMRVHETQKIAHAVWAGAVGVVAVLYYEFNTFAVLAVAPLIAVSLWQARSSRPLLVRRLAVSAICVVPAAITTLYFYFRNKAASADYTGTAMSLADPFFRTFRNGIFGAFPAASWGVANDWLPNPIRPTTQSVMVPLVGIAIILVAINRSERSSGEPARVPAGKLLLASSPFLVYWAGATFTQAATLKVQQEAVRLGQVYNYYAVGSTCFVVVSLLVFLWFRPRLSGWRFRAVGSRLLVAVVALLTVAQFVVNWNVMVQFNGATSGSSRLMIAFADAPPMDQRCAALDTWKTMGWPEYYWLDMELGLNAAYRIYKNEEFCKR